MKFLKNKAFACLLFLIILLVTTVFYTLLLYNGAIDASESALNIATFIMGILIFFLTGLISGVKEQEKGWLAGGTTASLIIVIVIIIKLITHQFHGWFEIVKILTYLFASIVGGMLGVNLTFLKPRKNRKKHK